VKGKGIIGNFCARRNFREITATIIHCRFDLEITGFLLKKGVNNGFPKGVAKVADYT
jgi:hypothetical protein